MDKEQKLELLISLMDEKNISNMVVIDVSGVYTESDYFVIGTALNERNARALCDHIDEKTKENGIEKNGIEGYDGGKWILMDYGDIIVHIFTKTERELYDLEKLWSSGTFLDMRSRIKKRSEA